MGRPRLYPFLLAAAPVLHTLADNPGVSSGTDELLIVGATLGVTGLLYLLVRVALRGRDAARLAPLVTLLVVGWLFWYRTLADGAGSLGLERPYLVLAPVLAAGSVALLLRARRRPLTLRRAEALFGLTGALLVGFSAVRIASHARQERALVRQSGLLHALARPIPAPSGTPAARRDIYLIIVDQYANSTILRERFGYDNRMFEDSLRALGFHIPRSVRSNYAHTLLSIPSLLNATHVTALERELGPRGTDPTVANLMVSRSRVAEFVKSRGYRYVFFPSYWWYATSESPQADVEPQVWDDFELRRELTRTALRRAALEAVSVPGRWWAGHAADADHVRRTLRGVALAHRWGRPAFVVAHVISPHPPYAVDRYCRSPPARPRYAEQIQCLNRQLLELVTGLIRSHEVPPIIILQGDHGTKSLGFDERPSADEVPASAARERFGAFGAYYLPDGGAAEVGDTVTVVNVLGSVLRHYFGADLPREPDVQYLSMNRTPFDFHRVDPAWLAPSHRSVRGVREASALGR